MYKFLRPFLFFMDAEKAHKTVLGIVEHIPAFGSVHSPKNLQTEVCGIHFPNPVGLAAGFDKHAQLVSNFPLFGFGFLEVGTVTLRPQQGSVKPRLFRLPKEQALLNRMGFNNHGMEAVARRLKTRDTQYIVGANIGKNKDTPNEKAVEDYVSCYNMLALYVHYVTVNISSPNTPGLRQLQDKMFLQELFLRLPVEKPLFIKIAPGLSPSQLDDIVEIVSQRKNTGIIATNTIATEKGGISGRPLVKQSTETIRYVYSQSQGQIPIIGVGGIFSAQDAYEKIRAGASLVQLYTGFVYEGPGIARRIQKGLVELLRRDGFSSVAEAVGTTAQNQKRFLEETGTAKTRPTKPPQRKRRFR